MQQTKDLRGGVLVSRHVWHIVHLWLPRFVQFVVVGALGVLINSAVLLLIVEGTSLSILPAAFIAAEFAAVFKFAIDGHWTPHRDAARWLWLERGVRFVLVAQIGILSSLVLLALAIAKVGVHFMVANLVAIAISSGVNFACNSWLAWTRVDLEARNRTILAGNSLRTAVPALSRLGYGTLSAVVVAVFLCGELLLIGQRQNGPFFDEGIYITAGLRTLEGYGIADYYLTWFAGSLLWPALAGLGFTIGGLEGARIAALLCVAIALVAVVLATRNLFGTQAGFWAGLALALNGPLLTLGRMAVYDVLALAGIGISFWAVTELGRRDNRVWLMIAALSLATATLSKYPTIICAVPLLLLLMWLRREQARLDLMLVGFIVLGVLAVYHQPWRGQLSIFLHWRMRNNPTFGVTPTMVRYSLLYLSIVPLALGCVGWFVARRYRFVATILLGSMLIWPAYHIATHNSVGDHKHVVFGFLFGYPLIGIALASAWRRPVGRAVVGLTLVLLAAVGSWQMRNLDFAWPDSRPAASYLAAQVHPGEHLLAAGAWSYSLYLYSGGSIASPLAMYDSINPDDATTTNRPVVGPCEFDWLIDERGSYAWTAETRATLEACGVYEPVFTSTSRVASLGRDLRIVTFPVDTVIWRNTAR